MSVYYVHAPDLGLVKIGYAEKPQTRFTKIQSDSPTRLVLLAIEAGDLAREAERHEQFADYRHCGEWFRHEGALCEHIKTLEPIVGRPLSLNAKIVAMGVSKTHASLIVRGIQPPSLSLAIAIWRATGWKCPRIEQATDEQLRIIEHLDPWTPKAAQDEAA